MSGAPDKELSASSTKGEGDEFGDSSSTPPYSTQNSRVLIPGEDETEIPEPVGNGKKKKSCRSSCINTDLLALKALLFIFYGGIGTISTWLNHTLTASRFSEKETLLIYGLSSILSIATPIVFGLFSDKTGQPKKVLGVCLVLGGLLYPLILTVPPAELSHQDRLARCRELASSGRNPMASLTSPGSFSCLPNRINCTENLTELIADYGGCSEGCGGRVVVTNCRNECHSLLPMINDLKKSEIPDYENAETGGDEINTRDDEDDYEGTTTPKNVTVSGLPPHVCVHTKGSHGKFPDKSNYLCYVFDKEMHNISVDAEDLAGYLDYDDGNCHYPLPEDESKPLLSCSPLAPNCHVTCELDWNSGNEWSCHSDNLQWTISFASFVAIHTLGTMLVISAAGLLNSAILSMSHEHGGYVGCQYTYATLGFAIVTPAAAYVFQLVESSWDIPWLVKHLEYLVAYSGWLLLSGLCVMALPYHAEWVPKSATVRPMLLRWTFRGHTTVFFALLAILGAFHGLIDVLASYQIKSLQASFLQIGLGATAAVAPSLVFICRVERVIEYCGHHNIFGIALVVYSLQFTGYAYLTSTIPEWSYLLRAMDTFSVVVVWVTASFTTYTSAPRSLAATCQTVVVTIYCCIGRGVGGLLGYVGLHFIAKDVFLKTLAVVAIVLSGLHLIVHYFCLKPSPYTRQYDFDRSATLAPVSRYTPLKLINGRRGKNNSKAKDELDDDDL